MLRWLLFALLLFSGADLIRAQDLTPAAGCSERAACGGVCKQCGCKCGPGYRSKKTGRCVSHKQLRSACGDPPDPVRCTAELTGSKQAVCTTKPKPENKL